MNQPEFRVFFYDHLFDPNGKDGTYYTLDEALREDFVRAEGNKLKPTDDCSIIEWSFNGGVTWMRISRLMEDHEAVAWAVLMGLELRESRPGKGLPYKQLFLGDEPVGIEWKGLGYKEDVIYKTLAIALFDDRSKDHE